MPEQDVTWEIDWDEMVSSADGTTGGWEFPDSIHRIAQAIIAAYRRQQAERGIVEVQRDFLNQVKEMVDWLAEPCTAMGDDQAVYDELARLAATTKDQP